MIRLPDPLLVLLQQLVLGQHVDCHGQARAQLDDAAALALVELRKLAEILQEIR